MTAEQVDRWKWISSALVGLVMFLLGAFIGDVTTSAQIDVVSHELYTHEVTAGHPVILERVERLERSYNQQLEDMNRKLDEIIKRMP